MKKTIQGMMRMVPVALAAFAMMVSCAPAAEEEVATAAIEEGAKITLGIDNDAYGNALVALWDKTYPEHAGAVTFLNTPSDSSAKRLADLQGDAPDVVMALTSDVPKFAGAMAPIPADIVALAEANVDAQFYKAANAMFQQVTAIPFAYDGMAFAWNKTMLTALGLDVSAIDKDGLPEAFNTWEEIFALAEQWKTARPTYNGKTVDIVFPMSLDEPWSGYSSTTAGGWGIFKEGDALKPGFEKPEFLKGLEFIKAASDAMISVEANGQKTPGSSMGWRWDPVLENQTAPFGLVGTWMDVKGATTKGGHEMMFGPMPTWNGVRLAPYLKVKVYVINAYSKFPGAAEALYRLIFSKEGMQAMIDNSSYVPALQPGAAIAPDYSNDKVKQQMGYAFQYSYVEPVTLTLPQNPNKQAMDVYYNIGMPQFYKDIWDGVKTPAEAQAAIVSAAEAWIAENNKL